MSGEITLARTYFLARESDLEACFEQYLKRIERVRKFTEVYLISDAEFPEPDGVARSVLLSDLRSHWGDTLNEDEWDLYSYSTALGSIEEPIAPGASVSRLWEDLLLTDEEEYPKSFISQVQLTYMSRA
ncbi:hypothetical protein [Corynebacterium sp.]|uniref:hypothetical protein n=1 Tax=Corynebacterium sp. TaxID=1720 RepID=UPI0026DB1D7E|nr:hypothetical protein [Corynebacterium sp.]MDO5031133.1 hypothetical protein [Corynebacterium sp.]